MREYIKFLTVLTIIGTLAGCTRTVPIARINSTVNTGHTQAEVKNAILKAGVQRQWIMSEVKPGVIKARQQSNKHIAEVQITYTATGYDIKYDSSLNLKGSGGKIHKSYNRWVHNLDKDIQVQLSTSTRM